MSHCGSLYIAANCRNWSGQSCKLASSISSYSYQVDQYLRVMGHQRVFAVGDATDVPETKLGYLAKAQVLTQDHSRPDSTRPRSVDRHAAAARTQGASSWQPGAASCPEGVRRCTSALYDEHCRKLILRQCSVADLMATGPAGRRQCSGAHGCRRQPGAAGADGLGEPRRLRVHQRLCHAGETPIPKQHRRCMCTQVLDLHDSWQRWWSPVSG